MRQLLGRKETGGVLLPPLLQTKPGSCAPRPGPWLPTQGSARPEAPPGRRRYARVEVTSAGGRALPSLPLGGDKTSGEPEPGSAERPPKWTSGPLHVASQSPRTSLPGHSGSQTVSAGGENALSKQIIPDFSLHPGRGGFEPDSTAASQVRVDAERISGRFLDLRPTGGRRASLQPRNQGSAGCSIPGRLPGCLHLRCLLAFSGAIPSPWDNVPCPVPTAFLRPSNECTR